MLFQVLATTALAVKAASAFRDSSPFFMFSTEVLTFTSANTLSIDSAANVLDRAESTLEKSGCNAGPYVFITQPEASAVDFRSRTATPHMKRWMSGQSNHAHGTVLSVANVQGEVSVDGLVKQMERQCGVSSVTPVGVMTRRDGELQVIEVNFEALSSTSGSERASMLTENDAYLSELLETLGDRYTVIYTTTPPSNKDFQHAEHPQQYEMDEPYSPHMHTDLKRDVSEFPRASNSSSNLNANLPLFETYQFLNSGIFMSVSVSLLLLSILYVAISAISGLEVSYMAFSKEMGPNAQKKQQ